MPVFWGMTFLWLLTLSKIIYKFSLKADLHYDIIVKIPNKKRGFEKWKI